MAGVSDLANIELRTDTMATAEVGYIRIQLEERRARLVEATHVLPADAALAELTAKVDEALARIEAGTYGICETCHETIESDRLIADPLVRLCLDHLTPAESRALESDLELASRIQRGLLPPQDMQAAGWQAHYHYAPASLVSGDYLDLIELNDGSDSFVFALGDASGKGVAASMLMTQMHAVLRSLISVGMPLAQLLVRANHLLCEGASAGQYATLVVGKATASGQVELASAGHWPSLWVRRDAVEQIGSTGLPLGMFCEMQLNMRTLSLAPGEMLVLYSDGISEQQNPSGVEFGIPRLAEIAAAHHGRAPHEFTAACIAQLKAFQSHAPQSDDQSVLVLQRLS